MGKKAFSLQKRTYKVISGGEIGLFSSFSPPLPQLYPQKYGKGGRTALPKILLTLNNPLNRYKKEIPAYAGMTADYVSRRRLVSTSRRRRPLDTCALALSVHGHL